MNPLKNVEIPSIRNTKAREAITEFILFEKIVPMSVPIRMNINTMMLKESIIITYESIFVAARFKVVPL